jgi:hypothetical protein
MRTSSQRDPSPLPDGTMTWLLGLMTRLLAGALNMPEPLLHDTGIFVFAQVQAAERSLGKKLCAIRPWRQFRKHRD